MHHTPPPQPERGAYILREPKGDPDVILITRDPEAESLLRAAAILAVQGYTARLVVLLDEACFAAQDEAFREGVLPAARAGLTLRELDTPQATAQEARRRIRAALAAKEGRK